MTEAVPSFLCFVMFNKTKITPSKLLQSSRSRSNSTRSERNKQNSVSQSSEARELPSDLSYTPEDTVTDNNESDQKTVELPKLSEEDNQFEMTETVEKSKTEETKTSELKKDISVASFFANIKATLSSGTHGVTTEEVSSKTESSSDQASNRDSTSDSDSNSDSESESDRESSKV